MDFIFRETEASLNSAKQKYLNTGKIETEVFDLFYHIDPTASKKYLEWLCRIYLKGGDNSFTVNTVDSFFSSSGYDEVRLEEYRSIFLRFEKLAKAGCLEPEISKYNCFRGLMEAIEYAENQLKSPPLTSMLGQLKEGEDYEIAEDNAGWTAVRVLTYKASTVLGRNVKWCLVQQEFHWKNYANRFFWIIFLFKKTKGGKHLLRFCVLAKKRFGGPNDLEVWAFENHPSEEINTFADLDSVFGLKKDYFMSFYTDEEDLVVVVGDKGGLNDHAFLSGMEQIAGFLSSDTNITFNRDSLKFQVNYDADLFGYLLKPIKDLDIFGQKELIGIKGTPYALTFGEGCGNLKVVYALTSSGYGMERLRFVLSKNHKGNSMSVHLCAKTSCSMSFERKDKSSGNSLNVSVSSSVEDVMSCYFDGCDFFNEISSNSVSVTGTKIVNSLVKGNFNLFPNMSDRIDAAKSYVSSRFLFCTLDRMVVKTWPFDKCSFFSCNIPFPCDSAYNDFVYIKFVEVESWFIYNLYSHIDYKLLNEISSSAFMDRKDICKAVYEEYYVPYFEKNEVKRFVYKGSSKELS